VLDLRLSIPALLLVALPASGEDVRALMLQARTLQLRGGGADPMAAAAIYRRVLEQVPGSAEANLRLSESLQEAQDPDAAVAPAKQAVALAPQNAEAQAHLALLQYERSRKDASLLPEAAKDLRTATLRLPGDPELWARLGEVSEQMKDNAGALKAWIRLGRLRPSFGPAWERALIHARAIQDYEGKREALLALNARNPEDRHLRMLEELAREQIQAGYLAHAEESFLLLASHVPQEPGFWENVGNFFGEDIFVAVGAILLMKGFLSAQKIEVSVWAMSFWGIPTALVAFAVVAWAGYLWLLPRACQLLDSRRERVLRLIMRRALYHGQTLGLNEPSLSNVAQ